MILIFGALLAVYVFCRAILPLKLKWGWKLLLAALLAVAVVVILHLWKHNNLLSIFGGTILYMFLVLFIIMTMCFILIKLLPDRKSVV